MSLEPTTDTHASYLDCDACSRRGVTVTETITGGRYCSETCARRDHAKITPGYAAILAEAMTLGWPLIYRRDLTLHDRRELARRAPDVRFLWVLRDAGTHLVYPDADPGPGTATVADLVRMIETSFQGERTRWYRWDCGLEQITREQACSTATRWAEQRARMVA